MRIARRANKNSQRGSQDGFSTVSSFLWTIANLDWFYTFSNDSLSDAFLLTGDLSHAPDTTEAVFPKSRHVWGNPVLSPHCV